MQLKKIFGLAAVGLGSVALAASGYNIIEAGQLTFLPVVSAVSAVSTIGWGAHLNLSPD